jgi:hypothetical protein
MCQSPILLDSTAPIRGRSNRYAQVIGGQEFESARLFRIVDPHNDGDTTVTINPRFDCLYYEKTQRIP